MALVICADCGKERSDQAPACPHCGRPNPVGYVPFVAPERSSGGLSPKGCLAILALLSVGFCTYQVNRTPDGPQLAEAPAPPPGPSDGDYQYNAERLVKSTLRDPESAKFSDVVVVRKPSGVAVCGYVNAKNGFGGYTGPTEFVHSALGLLIRTDDNASRFVKRWNRDCASTP